ncbi:MAG TPA: ABC transporter permease [Pyrinomonadaceae bacterium]|nr:ABC transporter permease [Pyrinomonadaceae bacterium]
MKLVYTFFADAARIALQSVFAHKLRAFLTLLGVIIGVASFVTVGAAINGLNAYVIETVSKVLGVNHFMIDRMAQHGEMSDDEWERRNRRNKPLKWDDYEWVRERCVACKEVAAATWTVRELRQGDKVFFGAQIIGVSPGMAVIEDKKIAEGRFIQQDEVDRSALVAVIGWDIREKFFEGSDPVGKNIKIGGLPMRVVGVEEKRGSMFGDSLDKQVYIPVSTHLMLFGRHQSVQIHANAESEEKLRAAIEDARTALRTKRRLKGNEEDNFGLVNTADLRGEIDGFTGAIAAVIVPVAGITLGVGAIVVMNIMLVSVTERTFEVGLRKAVGATRKQILLQFLIESATLCAIGGILGLGLAWAISFGVNAAFEIPMPITAVYIVLAVFVSAAVGIVAGIYPAFKASRLDPIVALQKA